MKKTIKGWTKVENVVRERLHEFTGAQLKVWLCHRLHEGQDGESYPSLETLGRETGLDTHTICEARMWLRENGWLETVGERDDKKRFSVKIEKTLVPANPSKKSRMAKKQHGENTQSDYAEKAAAGKPAPEVDPFRVAPSGVSTQREAKGDGESQQDVRTHSFAPPDDCSARIPEEDREEYRDLCSELEATPEQGDQIWNLTGGLDSRYDFLIWVKKHKYWSKRVWENEYGDSPATALLGFLNSGSERGIKTQYLLWVKKARRKPDVESASHLSPELSRELDRIAAWSASGAKPEESPIPYLEGEIDMDVGKPAPKQVGFLIEDE